MPRYTFIEGDYDYIKVLKEKLDPENLEKLLKIPDPELHRWIADIILWAQPDRVFINTGSPEDLEYVRRKALEYREELPTKNPRHTVHFDGPRDLARDRINTKILVPGGKEIPFIKTLDRDEGLKEIKEIMKGIMKGKEMFVGFYCLGPRGGPFTIYGVQVTDSAYVMHSENILYRTCYEDFVEKGGKIKYMRFLHSAGERDEHGWSKNIDKRRIYIDVEDETTYSTNTQYAGNTVGLKKLALRLCVYRACKEGWLCEHMFVVGVRVPSSSDPIYITGAFPAGCGKTTTAMYSDTIVGDDIAMIKAIDGVARAVNTEVGMFGIIDGINPVDDPEIYRILTSPDTEVIFSNVLLTEDGEVWWVGKEGEPRRGINYAGEWWPGKKDEQGREIRPSHPNARFTTSIRYLRHLDPRIDDPLGVPVSAMVFGGRDSDTWVPVEEAFDWVHGIITKGAALESERTTAVLEKAGVREFSPFAILDFLPISVGKFVEMHLEFAKKLKVVPKIFGVNYFLRDKDGKLLGKKPYTKVWLKWMALRCANAIDAIETPTGKIPVYQDLVKLFNDIIGEEFPEQLYEKMFTVRIPQHLAKIERIWRIYEGISDTPKELFEVLLQQKRRLEEYRSKFGDYISPFKLDRK